MAKKPIVSIIMRLDPERRETLLSAELKRYGNADRSIQTRVVAWLAGEKAYDKIMGLVPEEVLLKSAELFPIMVQGLAAQGRWEEMLALLKQGKKLPVSNARAPT